MNSAKISHLEKLRFESSKALVFIKCRHASGLDLFVYLKTDQKGYEKLLRDCEASAEITFSEYGDILLFGEGEPNEETRKFVETIEL